MKQYKKLIYTILEGGERLPNRTKNDTISILGYDMRFDLSEGFPAITEKYLPFKLVAGELLWFLSGESTTSSLRYYSGLSNDAKTIWDGDLKKYQERLLASGVPEEMLTDDLGFVYGPAWRNAPTIDGDGNVQYVDQIAQLIADIKRVKDNPSDPAARRLLVDAWDSGVHVNDPLACALPPCHYGFQCFVRNGKLSLKWIQRSADGFLGIPFNIASYALLTFILAKITGLQVGTLMCTLGDAHIYVNHIPQCKELLTRNPLPLPTLKMPEDLSLDNIDTYTANDFSLIGYQHSGKLMGELSN